MPVRGRGRGRRSQEASQLEQSLDSASLSTASLPSHYAVTVAKAGAEPTAAEYNEAYVRGAELISDIDKVTPGCGVSLVPLPPRQGLWHDNVSSSRHRIDGERKVMWRTAGLVYPCTCTFYSSVVTDFRQPQAVAECISLRRGAAIDCELGTP